VADADDGRDVAQTSCQDWRKMHRRGVPLSVFMLPLACDALQRPTAHGIEDYSRGELPFSWRKPLEPRKDLSRMPMRGKV